MLTGLPVTPILCTKIHASKVYEVPYGFGVAYLTYLNPKPGIRGTLRVLGSVSNIPKP
jgi:hypothetical protein